VKAAGATMKATETAAMKTATAVESSAAAR